MCRLGLVVAPGRARSDLSGDSVSHQMDGKNSIPLIDAVRLWRIGATFLFSS
jgi:hypothetical protein